MKLREKRNKQLRCLIASFADSYDGLIYHYTSPEGLRGIIDSGELWLTNTAFVNDTTEGIALKKKRILIKESYLENKFVQTAWSRFINGKDIEDNVHYMISFSKKKDSLDQWRAYGGYCIGFEAKELVRRGFHLYECVYRKDEIKAWILEKEGLSKWKGCNLDDERRKAAAYNLIYTASKKYKNNHYKSEQEVRLMAVSSHSWEYPHSPGMYEKDPPIHFRDHPAYKLPVPYVKFFVSKDDEGPSKDYDDTDMMEQEIKAEKHKVEAEQERGLLPIKEVGIGPMANQKDAELACQILLKERGYKDVEIIPSKIPYRGF
jgi:hypothetical protein